MLAKITKIRISENALILTYHPALNIEVSFRVEPEKIKELKEKFKIAFSDIFTDPAVELTIEV